MDLAPLPAVAGLVLAHSPRFFEPMAGPGSFCRSGSLNSTLSERPTRMANVGTLSGCPALPFGAANHDISGANHTISVPQPFTKQL